MPFPKHIQERFAQEVQFVATQMAQASDPMDKLYFFSAIYGELGRTLNWEWDRDLAVLRLVLEQTYQLANARVRQIRGGDTVVRLPRAVFDMLTVATEDLAAYVADGMNDQETLYGLIGRFAELGFVTTGNGHFLYHKGLIKLSRD